jgi:hypothetical protein
VLDRGHRPVCWMPGNRLTGTDPRMPRRINKSLGNGGRRRGRRTRTWSGGRGRRIRRSGRRHLCPVGVVEATARPGPSPRGLRDTSVCARLGTTALSPWTLGVLTLSGRPPGSCRAHRCLGLGGLLSRARCGTRCRRARRCQRGRSCRARRRNRPHFRRRGRLRAHPDVGHDWATVTSPGPNRSDDRHDGDEGGGADHSRVAPSGPAATVFFEAGRLGRGAAGCGGKGHRVSLGKGHRAAGRFEFGQADGEFRPELGTVP